MSDQTDEQPLKFSDEVDGLLSAFSEGLQERAHEASTDGRIHVQLVYELIDEALRAGAEAVIQGQLAAKVAEIDRLQDLVSQPDAYHLDCPACGQKIDVIPEPRC